MADSEKLAKVVEDLELSLGTTDYGYAACHYGSSIHGITSETLRDVIALLKAQEPVEPTIDIRHGKSMWRCGSCSAALQPNQLYAKFCFNCGQAVKWE